MGESSLGRGPSGYRPRLTQNNIWANDNTRKDDGLFVKIESAGYGKVSDVNLIVMEKWLRQNADGYRDCHRTREGDLVLLTKDEKQAERLCKQKIIPVGPERSMNVTIKLMENLNTSKVYSRELLNIPLEGEEGLETYLTKSNVIKIERIKTKDKDGNLNESGLHIITFGTRQPPEEIKIGYMKYNVRTWYPGPMKCIKCMKFGHSKARCTAKVEICKICGEEKHEERCEKKKCIHCEPPNDDHQNFDGKCPVMIFEKAICRIKVDKNISFAAARKEMEQTNRKTYASTLNQTSNQELDQIKMHSRETDNIIKEVQEELEKLAKKKKILSDMLTRRNTMQKEYDADLAKFTELKNQEPINTTNPSIDPILIQISPIPSERTTTKTIPGNKGGRASNFVSPKRSRKEAKKDRSTSSNRNDRSAYDLRPRPVNPNKVTDFSEADQEVYRKIRNENPLSTILFHYDEGGRMKFQTQMDFSDH
jgi:hypothetical protein